MGDGGRRWSLGELAEETGVSRRTIRYYISRGLLDAPLKAGRSSCYGEKHLEGLKLIRRLQDEGMSLVTISRELAGPPRGELPEAEIWQCYELAPDLRVQVRGEISPWRMREIRALLKEIKHRLEEPDGDPAERRDQGRISG